jgi:hypothetical protein
MVDKERHKVLVHEEPTTMHRIPVKVTLSQTFVLNNHHQYIWRVVGISDVDEHYVTYIAHEENNQGWVNIVVPRKWSAAKMDEDERQ